jgi:hypothetical protein
VPKRGICDRIVGAWNVSRDTIETQGAARARFSVFLATKAMLTASVREKGIHVKKGKRNVAV